MRCPICASDLKDIQQGCHVCPQGHGVLLGASQLSRQDEALVRAIDAVDAEVPQARHRQYLIACPACGHDMTAVNYCGSGVMIDSCLWPGCQLRWLDGDELRNIKDRKALLPTEDKAMFTSLGKEAGLTVHFSSADSDRLVSQKHSGNPVMVEAQQSHTAATVLAVAVIAAATYALWHFSTN
ncbi:zf-TFIIB domain-containing protein [Candidatus Saccharibacteria bacterium]|nr:MAG: zf-TFIIB domain-containing protein [Candidatus Saccharibacteria bacterium]